MMFSIPKLLQNTVCITSDRQGTVESYAFQTRELLAFFRNLISSIGAAYSSADAVSPVALTASPMTYAAEVRESIHITGGTVTGLSFVRGSTTLALATTAGQMVMLNPGDQLVITYSSDPTITSIPR